MKYSDQQRIVKIYEYASKLNAYIKEHHVTQEEVLTDFSLQWLITTPLYNIGEQAYHLSAWNVIALVVFEEIPMLLEQLEQLKK